jgi:hypothetical protein
MTSRDSGGRIRRVRRDRVVALRLRTLPRADVTYLLEGAREE